MRRIFFINVVSFSFPFVKIVAICRIGYSANCYFLPIHFGVLSPSKNVTFYKKLFFLVDQFLAPKLCIIIIKVFQILLYIFYPHDESEAKRLFMLQTSQEWSRDFGRRKQTSADHEKKVCFLSSFLIQIPSINPLLVCQLTLQLAEAESNLSENQKLARLLQIIYYH